MPVDWQSQFGEPLLTLFNCVCPFHRFSLYEQTFDDNRENLTKMLQRSAQQGMQESQDFMSNLRHNSEALRRGGLNIQGRMFGEAGQQGGAVQPGSAERSARRAGFSPGWWIARARSRVGGCGSGNQTWGLLLWR